MTADVQGAGTSRFELETQADSLVLRLMGEWRLSDGIASTDSLFEGGRISGESRPLKADASQVTAWDSALICFLVDLKKRCDKAGVTLDLSSLPEGARRLVALAFAVPEREGAKRKSTKPAFLESVGNDVLLAYRSGSEMLDFLGQALIASARLFRGKAQYRMKDVFSILQDCGPLALPITSLIAFLVGIILAFVGLIQLEQFGADLFVANLVGVAMVRELGGMMTGIIMAGRTGAAFAAQLGTMNVNEEIAAYRTVGIDPIEFLVVPRMLALIIAVPLLSIYANFVGMIGGAIVATSVSDITLLQFYNQTVLAVDLTDWATGLLKATIYGVIIAIAGCLRGVQCKMSAAAVGNAATSAVVTAIVFIIAAQAVLTVVYQVLGV